MRLTVALLALAAALVAASSAQAGGWATVGVAPLPDGTSAGDTWRPDITVLQHGETPLGGLTPTLTISEPGGGAERRFTATETDKTGVYTAEVVFPTSGEWFVHVETGWWGEGDLSFGPVAIDDAPGGIVGADELPFVPTVLVALVLALLVAVAFGARRISRPTPAGG